MAGPKDSGAPGPSKLLDYDTVFTNAKVCHLIGHGHVLQ